MVAENPLIGKDYLPHWVRPEDIKRLGLVLTLCDGNAFRSRLGKKLLNDYQIPTISAAVGDISKQTNKVFPPSSVINFANIRLGGGKSELGWVPGRIKQVTPLLAECAAHILVFCDESHLPDYIDPTDNRVHICSVQDPKDETEYGRTYDGIRQHVMEFVRDYYPERLYARSAPAYASREISDRISATLRNLDFSCMPAEWGPPLQQSYWDGDVF